MQNINYFIDESGVWIDDVWSESLNALRTDVTFPIAIDSSIFMCLGMSDMNDDARREFSNLLQRIYERWVLEVIVIYIIESVLRDKYSDEALDTFWRFLIDEFPQCIIDSWIKENNKTYKFICKMQRISLIDELIENYLENTLKYFIQSHDPGENVERYFEIGKFGLSGNLSYEQLSRVLFQNSTSKSGVWLHDSHKKFVFKDDLVSTTNRKDVNYITGIIAKLNAHRGKYINSRENNGKKTIKPFLNSVDACFFHLLFGNEKEYRKLIDHFRSDTAYFAPARELFVFLDDLKDIYNQFSEEMSYDHPDKSEIDEINYRLHYYKSIIALHLPSYYVKPKM